MINTEFIIWWNDANIFEILIAIIGGIIVSLPIIFMILAIFSLFSSNDSNGIENNDCGWL